MLVTDPGVAAAGLADRALEHLGDAVVFDGVRPNPDIALVDEGARLYAESDATGSSAWAAARPSTRPIIGVVARRRLDRAVQWGHDPIEHRIQPSSPSPRRPAREARSRSGRSSRTTTADQVQRRRHAALARTSHSSTQSSCSVFRLGYGGDGWTLSHAIECYTCDYHQR
jgi:hypothetical protein